jgi:hypothetical protein
MEELTMKTTLIIAASAVVIALVGISLFALATHRIPSIDLPLGKRPWNPDGRTDAVTLPGVTVVPGGHCESSAIMNALRFSGYPVEECEVTGGGGALAFIFSRGAFPFLGGRNEDMKERFFETSGIAWHRGNAVTADSGWAEIVSLLERGIPVVVRNDMRFLSYRYGGKRGPSWSAFGGHYVTLFGIDFGKSVAWVSDTEYDRLKAVSLAELHRARTSRTRVFPPLGEFYWVERAPEAFALDRDRLARSSIAAVLSNYRSRSSAADPGAAPLVGLSGMERYPDALRDLESWGVKPFLLAPVLEYMAGNIEDFGTGGASFRRLYRDFLVRETDAGAEWLAPLVPLIEDSVASWHALSAEFRSAAITAKGKNSAAKALAMERVAKRAEDLLRSEKAFYTGLEAVARSQGVTEAGN